MQVSRRQMSRDKKTLLLGSPNEPKPDPDGDDDLRRAEGSKPKSPRVTRKGTEIIDPGEHDEPSSVSPSVVPSPPVSSRRSTTEIMRTSITEGRKSTTLIELSVVADDLATSGTRRLWMIGGGSTLLALAVACVVLLSLPGWAEVLLVLVPLGMLLSTFAGTLLKQLTRALGASGRRELPGGVHWYVAAVASVVLVVSLGATWGTVEAATVVSERLLPPRIDAPDEKKSVVERPRLASRMADRDLKKGGLAERLAPGLLYVPSSFSSSDGAFDLLIHFHGVPPLVQDSVEAAKLNAVVLTVNLGLGGGPYKARMAYRDAFDGLVDKIEKRMADNGLEKARVRRVGVSAWSAGYGAVFTLLEDPERSQKVDALLLLDTPHGSFVGGARDIQPESVAPYVAFARKAIDGKRLMVVTHSAITTDEYPSTTETTDLILNELHLDRSPGGEPVATPDFASATSAFPGGNRTWLEPTTTCRAGQFALMGYAGRSPENHIAHLAQMSETALPLLVRRWR